VWDRASGFVHAHVLCVACSGHLSAPFLPLLCEKLWDDRINVKARRWCIRQCWLNGAVRGDSAGGRGSANGALRRSVPVPQEPRYAPSRAPQVWFGVWFVCVGVLVTVAGGGPGDTVLRGPWRVCLHLIGAGRFVPRLFHEVPYST